MNIIIIGSSGHAKVVIDVVERQGQHTIVGQDLLSSSSESIAALPLAPIVAGGELPLVHNLNPAWSVAMQAFRLHVVQPLLGADPQSLSAAQWQALQAQLAPCQAWLAAYPGSVLGDMSPAEAQALLEGGAQTRLQELIARDEEEKQHNQQAVQLEKLIRYQRDLLKLLNNFVNFADFYRREGAAFQAASLYLDGRSWRRRWPGWQTAEPAMRNAFIAALTEAAAVNDKIVLVVGDLGYGVVEAFAQRFPQRFFNAGVAEQNMMGLAAGLASEGFHVFVYSIANFPTFRCAEQIRNDVDYHQLEIGDYHEHTLGHQSIAGQSRT